MKHFRQFLDRLLPPYARVPALSVIGMNLVVYYVPKLLETHRSLHLVSTSLDDALPRVPVFAIIYVLAYAQWAIGLITICRESRAHCFRVTAGVLISEALVLLVFLVYPTTLRRPPVEVRDLPTAVLDWVYRRTRRRTSSLPCTVCRAGSASAARSGCAGRRAGIPRRSSSSRCWSLPP